MTDAENETVDVIERRRLSDTSSTMIAGCLSTVVSAMVTAVLLFANGALVLAVWSVITGTEDSWLANQKLSQFILYTAPVGLVILEWIMIDYVRTRFGSR